MTDDIIVEMQHRHRKLMHELKGIYALLNNNLYLSERRGWTPEQAMSHHQRVMRIACERLKEIFE